jgi:hypothetical protein
MAREYQNDADLQKALINLGLRRIGDESYRDDSTGETYTAGFEDPPTPEERGERFTDIYQAMMESRRSRRF